MHILIFPPQQFSGGFICSNKLKMVLEYRLSPCARCERKAYHKYDGDGFEIGSMCDVLYIQRQMEDSGHKILHVINILYLVKCSMYTITS